MAAFVETVFLRGGALLYGSQEVAYPEPLNFFHWKPINWMSNPEVYNEYKTLLTLYNKYGALKWGQLVAYPAVDAMVFEKRYEKQDFLILVNVRNRDVNVYIPKEFQGQRVTDMMRDSKMQLPDLELTLQPYEYFILRK